MALNLELRNITKLMEMVLFDKSDTLDRQLKVQELYINVTSSD